MHIEFATCERLTALNFLRAVYPGKDVVDTPDCAGPLLDLVAQDILRVQDPMMYGGRIGIVAGKAYEAHHAEQAASTAQEFARRASELPAA